MAKLNKDILATLAMLADRETAFLRARFLAPVLRGQKVAVRVGGVRCEMAVEPASFDGWGVFAPASHALAKLERPATLSERRAYVRLLPGAALILVERRSSRTWLALPARLGDGRFTIEAPVPVRLVEDVGLFDTVVAGFDGRTFWFEDVDPQASPAHAAYLRESITAMLDPRRLERPGLSKEQRLAYAYAHNERLRAEMLRKQRAEEAKKAVGERRIRTALEHAGATLRDFAEQNDVYRVTYSVDGARHTSVIRKNDLTVQSAGICLSGQDDHFDLASLVGVLRLGQSRGGIRHGLAV